MKIKITNNILFKPSHYLMMMALPLACLGVPAHADDHQPLPLPPAPGAAVTSKEEVVPATVSEQPSKPVKALKKLKLEPIAGKVPYYVDKGVTMIPIRPICDFLDLGVKYRSGVVSISGILSHSLTKTATADDSKKQQQETEQAIEDLDPIFVNLRDGSRMAQVIEGVHNRTIKLELAPETRLGVTFVPLRFIASVFDARVSYNAESELITVQRGNHLGYLRQPDQCDTKGKKTTELTVINRVGRGFTLQLEGPCDFRIELGRLQKVAVELPSGLYEYTAVSQGSYPRRGKRWLRSKAKVKWTFGE